MVRRDPDSGLTIYIQSRSPGTRKESNWLPSPPNRAFKLIRLVNRDVTRAMRRTRRETLSRSIVNECIALSQLERPIRRLNLFVPGYTVNVYSRGNKCLRI